MGCIRKMLSRFCALLGFPVYSCASIDEVCTFTRFHEQSPYFHALPSNQKRVDAHPREHLVLARACMKKQQTWGRIDVVYLLIELSRCASMDRSPEMHRYENITLKYARNIAPTSRTTTRQRKFISVNCNDGYTSLGFKPHREHTIVIDSPVTHPPSPADHPCQQLVRRRNIGAKPRTPGRMRFNGANGT